MSIFRKSRLNVNCDAKKSSNYFTVFLLPNNKLKTPSI